MNRFQWWLALIGIVLSTCFGAVHESAGQSSTLTAFYTAPVVFNVSHVDRQGGRFFQEAGARR